MEIEIKGLNNLLEQYFEFRKFWEDWSFEVFLQKTKEEKEIKLEENNGS